MRVAVCVITCRRPEGLQRLLRALNALTFRGDPPDIEVIVVDNDADTSAASVCDLLRRDLNWPLRYEVEPQRGIPFARNRAVACAADTADFVSFIDDDEVPQPSWLDELLAVQR
ncbi:MAG: glycosyltransferase family 2 protein, partial [Phycisphaerales bacterium]